MLPIELSPFLGDSEAKLLIVLQDKFQQHLLRRYGDGVLLDSTFKTSSYDLSLYQIVVNTNCGYFPVGIIITEDDTKSTIAEGLKVFQQWNPDFKPGCFVVDDDECQIGAIQQIFPG